MNRKHANTEKKQFGINQLHINVSDCNIKIDFSMKYLFLVF
jgi:hypothetical protein